MANELRQSGIRVLGEIPWGTHVSIFYDTPQDLLDILVPYFKAGLQRHEYCLWVISVPPDLVTKEQALAALRQALPDLDRYLTEGSMEIIPREEWFLEGGTFDLARVVKRYTEKMNQAVLEGYAGMRFDGGSAWLLESGANTLREFEYELDKVIARQRLIVLCNFPLAAVSGDTVFDMAGTHRYTIARRSGQWETLVGSELEQAQAELKRLNAELEQRVAERTQQLTIVNEELSREIAEHWRIEQEAQTGRALLEKTFASFQDAVFVIDASNRSVAACNQAVERIFGYRIDEVIGRSTEFLHVDREHYERFAQEGDPVLADKGVYQTEFEMRRKDGQVFATESTVSLITDAVGKWINAVSVVRDVSERKRTEQERELLLQQVDADRERLQTLSQQLLDTQETERRFIARELHDEIGQAMTALKINLQSAMQMPSMKETQDLLAENIRIAERVLQQVRDLSLDLHPSLLDDLGLAPALRWYVDRVAQRAGLNAEFITDAEAPRAPARIEIACFRIAQETLTNVQRHARAKNVRVELTQRERELQLTIQDDGVGVDVSSALERAARGSSLGLVGMQERAQLVGGQLEIESSEDRGTRVRATFPLADQNRGEMEREDSP